MVKVNGNEVVLKRWITIISLIIMLVSLTFNVVMSLSISPIELRVGKVELKNELQDKKIHELDKSCAAHELKYQHIHESLSRIEKMISEQKQ